MPAVEAVVVDGGLGLEVPEVGVSEELLLGSGGDFGGIGTQARNRCPTSL